jgi:hypothetical protein
VRPPQLAEAASCRPNKPASVVVLVATWVRVCALEVPDAMIEVEVTVAGRKVTGHPRRFGTHLRNFIV